MTDWKPELVALDIDGTLLKWVDGVGTTYEQIPRATYDAVTKTCAGTYCHEGRGATVPSPRWDGVTSGCAACHGTPPPPPHTQTGTCGGTTCHEGTAGLSFTAAGRLLHVNGMIDRGAL